LEPESFGHELADTWNLVSCFGQKDAGEKGRGEGRRKAKGEARTGGRAIGLVREVKPRGTLTICCEIYFGGGGSSKRGEEGGEKKGDANGTCWPAVLHVEERTPSFLRTRQGKNTTNKRWKEGGMLPRGNCEGVGGNAGRRKMTLKSPMVFANHNYVTEIKKKSKRGRREGVWRLVKG